MKIGSRIKTNRDGSNRFVDLPGARYEFTPVKDKHDQIHHVAEVTDPDHAAILASHDAFYPFSTDMEKVPSLARPPAGGKKVVEPAVHTPEDLDAAALLLKGSAGDIGKAVGNSTPAIIRAALAVEGANAAPRKNVLGLLNATLEGIIAAGVKG